MGEMVDQETKGFCPSQPGSTVQQPGLESQLLRRGHDACGLAGGFLQTCAGVLESPPQYAAPKVEESVVVPSPPSGPAPGSSELPSTGSAGHAAGHCKPCAFVHTKGCENGLACQFCHLCGPEVRKAQRQEKLQQRREAHRAKQDKKSVRHCRSI